jgi:hypothetical protein
VPGPIIAMIARRGIARHLLVVTAMCRPHGGPHQRVAIGILTADSARHFLAFAAAARDGAVFRPMLTRAHHRGLSPAGCWTM